MINFKEFIYNLQFYFNKIKYYEYIFNKKTFILLIIFVYLLSLPHKSFFENILFAVIGLYILYDYLKNNHFKTKVLNDNFQNSNFYYKLIIRLKKYVYKKN